VELEAFRELPTENITVDIHCVTRWSKVGTGWEGVSLNVLLDGIADDASFALVRSYGGYTTNLPLEDLMDGHAWIAVRFERRGSGAGTRWPCPTARPALVLWKSAKWVRGITLLDHDEPGFWETRGGSSGIRATEVACRHGRRSLSPTCYVCGPTSFVEHAAGFLIASGHSPERIRTERFGPTGNRG
jgi:DMSO/TMAO reductase YedYZ molybdopterin-dependent catalytic subunit